MLKKILLAQTFLMLCTFSFAQNIKITGVIPKTDTGKMYQLQIGAFRLAVNANKASEILTKNGFVSQYERRGDLVRVFVVVKAADVRSAVDRLGKAGFKEVIIREFAGKAEDAKPDTAKQSEVKPAEVKPVEVKPVEVKPEEVKPAEIKAEETIPAEPVQTKAEEPEILLPFEEEIIWAETDVEFKDYDFTDDTENKDLEVAKEIETAKENVPDVFKIDNFADPYEILITKPEEPEHDLMHLYEN